jgi:class 3 adenylate cyclase
LPPAPANGASASALKPNVSQGEPSAAQLSREAQRGHVTVLLCDLVNLTGLDALGQEERREIIADYHRAATQAIERCGGHVTRNAGEGIMAYFGWPEPQENHAERAADAGLAILDAIEALNEGPSRSKLCARIGILSGTTLISGSNS